MTIKQLLAVSLPWFLVIIILDWAGQREDSLLLIFFALVLIPLAVIYTAALNVYFRLKNKQRDKKLKTRIYNEYAWWDPRRYL